MLGTRSLMAVWPERLAGWGGPWLVAVLSAVFSLWAVRIYGSAGLTLLYGDALARLDIARRVVSGSGPQLVQVGAVWPPLPQLLMALTVSNEMMWRTGLSGSIISIVAFVVSTTYVYRTVHSLTNSRIGAWLAAGVFVTNPNMLFMQTTPMVESLTVCLLCGAAFHFLRWAQRGSLAHLLASAAFVFFGTLTRYECWVLVPVGAVLVVVASLSRYRTWAHAEGLTLAWGVLASYGVILWLMYNQVAFGDALGFTHNPGSAYQYARDAARAGLLPTENNLLVAIATYCSAAVYNLGLPLAVLGVGGLVALLLSTLPLHVKVGCLLCWSVLPFSVLSLATGQSVLYVPVLYPFDFENVRYGLLMLPVAVCSAGYLGGRFRVPGGLLVLGVLLSQVMVLPQMLNAQVTFDTIIRAGVSAKPQAVSAAWTSTNFPFTTGDQQITFMEAGRSYLRYATSPLEAAAWIGERAPATNRILLSSGVTNNDLFVVHSGLPLSQFLMEGEHPAFDQELEAPGIQADWIVFRPNVGPREALEPLLQKGTPAGFQLVFTNADFDIYERSSLAMPSALEPGDAP